MPVAYSKQMIEEMRSDSVNRRPKVPVINDLFTADHVKAFESATGPNGMLLRTVGSDGQERTLFFNPVLCLELLSYLTEGGDQCGWWNEEGEFIFAPSQDEIDGGKLKDGKR